MNVRCAAIHGIGNQPVNRTDYRRIAHQIAQPFKVVFIGITRRRATCLFARAVKPVDRCLDIARQADDAVNRTVKTKAQRLCRENSGQSMEVIKEMLARLPEMGLEEGLRYAAQRNAEARGSDDCRDRKSVV